MIKIELRSVQNEKKEFFPFITLHLLMIYPVALSS